MITKKLVGTRIKSARQSRKITQQELASEVGVDVTTIGSYEQGRSYPSFKVLKAIAMVLSYPFEYFVTENDNNTLLSKLYLLEVEMDKIKEILKEMQKLIENKTSRHSSI